jgi:hypothetical protein
MVRVNIHSQETLSQKEVSLLVHMMFIMCTNPEFAEERQPITNDGLTLTRHILDDDGNETETQEESVSREEFVRTVNKGMNSVVQLTVQTPDGDKTVSRPFFPVTLIDIPAAKKASITLDYVPDFLPKFDDGKLGFMFRGELMEFAKQDIDETDDE